MREGHEIPRTEMPNEFHIGPVVIPAVYVRLVGVALTFGLIWFVVSLMD